MQNKIITTALLSMVPTFEGRYAVATAIAIGMPALSAYILALVCSTLPMPFIMLLLEPVMKWLRTLPYKPVQKLTAFVDRKSERSTAKMQASRDGKGLVARMRNVLTPEALELFALYVFVALPLPGTGVWTGTLVSVVTNMPPRKSALAILLGNMTACLIMTLVTVGAKTVL